MGQDNASMLEAESLAHFSVLQVDLGPSPPPRSPCSSLVLILSCHSAESAQDKRVCGSILVAAPCPSLRHPSYPHSLHHSTWQLLTKRCSAPQRRSTCRRPPSAVIHDWHDA
jgi:hypothetical protein